MTLKRHSEEHHYSLNPDEQLILTEWGNGRDAARTYLVDLVVVSINDGRVWKVLTLGPVIEEQYGLSRIQIRQEWEGARVFDTLKTPRFRPLAEWLHAHGHFAFTTAR